MNGMRLNGRCSPAAVVFAALALASAAAATTYYVNPNCGDDGWTGLSANCVAPDGPKATIQAAMAAASSGDTLVLADGSYTGTGNCDLHLAAGVDLVIRSANGAATCIIDCQAQGRFLMLDDGQTLATLLEGLTIQNGSAGMVFVSASSALSVRRCTFVNGQSGSVGGAISSSGVLSLSDSIFTGNSAASNGGAVYVQNNEAEIARCLFTGNSAADGGAVYAHRAQLTCAQCTFEQNQASTYDGAIAADANSTLTLADCIVRANASVVCCGGGSAYSGCTVELVRCEFTGNSSGQNGAGGFAIQANSRGTVRECTFSDNQTGGSGGGLWCGDSVNVEVTGTNFNANSARSGGAMVLYRSLNGIAKLDNCLFVGNMTGQSGGGALFNYTGNMDVAHCTFRGNTASTTNAGGVAAVYSAIMGLRDCLFVDNVSDLGALYNNGANIDVTNCTFSGNRGQYAGAVMLTSGSTDLENCVLWLDTPNEITVDGGTATAEFSDVHGGWSGIGNLDADPLFADPNNGNFRLQAGSRCIDAGDPNFVPAPGATDLDGRKRLWDGDANGVAVVDMGAYEFGSYCYGDLDCNGNCDFGDINPFVLALSNPAGYHAAFPDCDIYLADLNADGHVDFGDINPFVALLSGS